MFFKRSKKEFELTHVAFIKSYRFVRGPSRHEDELVSKTSLEMFGAEFTCDHRSILVNFSFYHSSYLKNGNSVDSIVPKTCKTIGVDRFPVKCQLNYTRKFFLFFLLLRGCIIHSFVFHSLQSRFFK